MNLNRFSKEHITIAFYIIYITISGVCFELFPGDAKNPNMGVLLIYVMIPISLIYFMYHLIKQLYGTTSYAKCLMIHGVAWLSIAVILSVFSK
ncbi:hypothetical protein [Flavobacterium aciduliphilum]|uniref:Uncharacterized protein n=1 Tax=Flavobacterium aciduliphilum TaxID=1101402 RepID=A0A328YG40_9FLAO|nr:hypothetical protein [Flavobacterium aciduliphilum]RAR72919.1 hypothetical protein CLV55_104180 [Flavobacterium aciduliphilum]